MKKFKYAKFSCQKIYMTLSFILTDSPLCKRILLKRISNKSAKEVRGFFFTHVSVVIRFKFNLFQ